VRVNGLTGLAVTKLDVLDSFSEIPVGVGYRLDGEPLDTMPAEVERLARVEPVYEALPGWQHSLSEVRRMADLPPAARAYLDRLQPAPLPPVHEVLLDAGEARDRGCAVCRERGQADSARGAHLLPQGGGVLRARRAPVPHCGAGHARDGRVRAGRPAPGCGRT